MTRFAILISGRGSNMAAILTLAPRLDELRVHSGPAGRRPD